MAAGGGPVIELTPAQRTRAWELAPTLRAVDQGEVWREADGTSVVTAREVFGVSDPIAEVIEEIRLAETAGFVVAVPLPSGRGHRWDLTDTGRAAVALHRTASGSNPSGVDRG